MLHPPISYVYKATTAGRVETTRAHARKRDEGKTEAESRYVTVETHGTLGKKKVVTLERERRFAYIELSGCTNTSMRFRVRPVTAVKSSPRGQRHRGLKMLRENSERERKKKDKERRSGQRVVPPRLCWSPVNAPVEWRHCVSIFRQPRKPHRLLDRLYNYSRKKNIFLLYCVYCFSMIRVVSRGYEDYICQEKW